MKIEMLPAADGDCIIISTDRICIIIDAGRKETYTSYLKKRFDEMLDTNRVIDLAVATHIDRDHIEGFIQLFSQKTTRKVVREIWYNAYHHFPQVTDTWIRGDYAQFTKYRSIEDSKNLTNLLLESGVLWNSHFHNQAVKNISSNCISVGDINIWVICPTDKQLSSLAKMWRRHSSISPSDTDTLENDAAFEDDMIRVEDDAAIYRGVYEIEHGKTFSELLSLQEEMDHSDTNASSIVLIIEHNNNTCLLTGDTHQNILIPAIEEWASVNPWFVKFDAIKVPHHASLRNTNKFFFEKFHANHFLISTDGIRHRDHPSKAVLAQIVKNNPKCNIIFNYDSHEGYKFLADTKNVPYRYTLCCSGICCL